MKNLKSRKKAGPFLSAIFIAAVMAFLFTYIIDSDTINILRQASGLKSSVAETDVNREDMSVDGFEIDGNRWTATKENPEIVINEVKGQVDYVAVIFSEALNWQKGGHILWTEDEDSEFFDERFNGSYAEEGFPYMILPVGRNVKDLKIRIPLRKGDVLLVKKVLINPELSEYQWENVGKSVSYKLGSVRYVEKAKILFVAFLVMLLPFVFGWENAFNRRWLIGGLLLLFLVVNKYNGDSLGIYDLYVQGGEGSEFVNPIVGEARHVRSDEWGNLSPRYMSTKYLDSVFEKNNYIIRGADSINEYALTWYSIYDPFLFITSILRFFIGFEYAYSFKWYAVLIFTFLINIDFFMIISKKQKLLSFCAACMVVLSSFYQWWAFPRFVTALPAIFVCIHGFIHAGRMLGKIAFAAGTGIFTSYYVLNFYPAWQVPVGYLMLALLVWLVHEEFIRIKSFSRRDWLMVGIAGAWCLMIIMGYLFDRSAYTSAMLGTVYPGKRFSTGGFSLYNMFNFIPAGLYPYMAHENPSSGGICVSLFPLPVLLGIYYQIKGHWKNWLINVLLIMNGFMLLYTTIGIPSWLAKISLMSYSPGHRTAEVLAYSQVILFAAVIAYWNRQDRFPLALSGLTAVLYTGLGLYFSDKRYPGYMTKGYMVFAGILFAGIVFMLLWRRLSEKFAKIPFFFLIFFCALTGLYVRPISKGLDAIDSKPLAAAVRGEAAANPHAKWIGQGVATNGFIVACGAPTINFVNTYPNSELWSRLDTDGVNEEYYNRFAYVSINFTEEDTSFSNPQADILAVQLSYKDIKKTEVEYIASTEPLYADNEYVRFDCIYDQSDAYIYKVHFKRDDE